MFLRYIFKALLLPPALQFAGMILAAVCWKRWPRFSRALMAVSFLSLLLLSLPLVGGALLGSLEAGYEPVSRQSVAAAQAIVVLGGGRDTDALEYGGDTVNARTLERLRYAAHLQRASALPLLVTGGVVLNRQRQPEAELMAVVLEQEFNVPVTWREGGSRTTAENASLSAELLLPAGVERILLVTHSWHMRRAEAVFRRAGLQVIPAPLGLSAPQPLDVRDFIASAGGLRDSYFALHEWLGYLVYRWQGQL